MQRYCERNVTCTVSNCHRVYLHRRTKTLAGLDRLDPSPAVARQLRHRLAAGGLLAGCGASSGERYFTSGALAVTADVMARLLAESVNLEALPERFLLMAGVAATHQRLNRDSSPFRW